jgi:biotin carboxylase
MGRRILFIESNSSGTGLLFFERARSMGFEPTLLSAKPNRYPFLAPYQRIRLEAYTPEAMLASMAQLGGEIAGVFSSVDTGIALAARVARAIGRPHGDPEVLELCRDKFAARRRLTDAGVSKLPFALARSGEEAAAFADSIEGPVVVKPRASTASINVRRCETPHEVRRFAEALIAANPRIAAKGVLLEAYVEGPEYSVEVFDGVSVGVTGKRLGALPAFVEIGHDFPAPDPPAAVAVIADLAERAVAACGHVRGPAHVEVRLGADGPCIIEINPRLAGDMIPEVVRWATGLDLVSESIRFACGEPYGLAASRNEAAAIRFLVRPSEGPVSRVEGLDDARSLPGVVDVGTYPDAFGHTGPVTDSHGRVGYVIARAGSAHEAGRIADQALGCLDPIRAP